MDAFLVIAIVDLIVLLIILRRIPKKLASRSWPQTAGLITKAEIIICGEYNENLRAEFAFTYKAAGSELNGNLSIVYLIISRFARKIIAEHPKGTTLIVRYNPTKPQVYFTELNKILALSSWIDAFIWPAFFLLTIMLVFHLIM